jgi:phage gp36-like protein
VPYATESDIENSIGTSELLAIADRDRSGSVDSDAVTLAIANADSVIDSYCARVLPIDPVPNSIRRASIALAIYELAGNHATEKQTADRDATIAWLRDVSRDVAKVASSTGEEDPDTSVDIVVDARDAHFRYDERGGLL